MRHKERVGSRLQRCVGKTQQQRVGLHALTDGHLKASDVCRAVQQDRVCARCRYRKGVGQRQGACVFGRVQTGRQHDNVVQRTVYLRAGEREKKR